MQKKLQKLVQATLSTATLISTVIAPIFYSSTPAAYAVPRPAASADAFIDSMCLNTHWGQGIPHAAYSKHYDALKQKLIELGIRHVRDGGTSNYYIAKTKDLADAGIKTTFIMSPNAGIAPNSSYWVTNPYYYIHDFVKNKVGTNAIDAVEVLNEIDLFYNRNGGYYWRPGDTEKLDNNPSSPYYWLSYAQSMTKDTWTALKSDPATAGVKVIGPSLGVTYDLRVKSPLGDLSSYVDWGNFHPYPVGGNPFNNPFSYNTMGRYFWDGNFPAVNIDRYPYAFEVYAPPFGSKPMAATETGYFTGTANRSISETVHGKYMPRLFLEYFRKNIARTCSYELVDQYNAPSNSESNYGLLRNDLSPKPAYTALKNLISVLKDPGRSFTLGSLDFTRIVNPPSGYNLTSFVHHLLLQKRDGSFYLVLWHEISNNDISSKPSREINPPPMPTKLTFMTPLSSATVYSLDDSGNMSISAATISNNEINLNVTDKAMIVKLTPSK